MPKITESQKHGGLFQENLVNLSKFESESAASTISPDVLTDQRENNFIDRCRDQIGNEPPPSGQPAVTVIPKRKSVRELANGHQFPENYIQPYDDTWQRDAEYERELQKLNRRFQSYEALKTNDMPMLERVTGRKAIKPTLEEQEDALLEPEVEKNADIFGSRQKFQRELEIEYGTKPGRKQTTGSGNSVPSKRDSETQGPGVGGLTKADIHQIAKQYGWKRTDSGKGQLSDTAVQDAVQFLQSRGIIALNARGEWITQLGEDVEIDPKDTVIIPSGSGVKKGYTADRTKDNRDHLKRDDVIVGNIRIDKRQLAGGKL